MTTKAATSRRLTRYVAGPALALGLAIGSAALANAEWDIEEYDNCMRWSPNHVVCCLDSGGVWTGPNAGEGKCVAPPPEAQSGRTPKPLPSEVPDQVLEPASPSAPGGGQVG
jgi:hypothetical protein